MVRLIASLIFFIVLAVFIAFNARYVTTISLFGYILEEVSTVAVLIISMAAGVLYSFSLYLSSYFAKRRSRRLKKAKDRTTKQAEELEDKEKELQDSRKTVGNETVPDGQSDGPYSPASSGTGFLKRHTGGKREKKP